MRKLIISTFLLIFTMSITAQNSIHGKVVDENNNPLSKAVVKLLQTKQSALTNEKGEFEFRDLKDFAYSLTVKYIGFETYEQIIKTGSTIIVQMKPLQVQLEDVIVVATRATASTPVAFTNVSKKQIDERNSGQDLPYLLMLTPSF
ncbi:MAG: TonB-dependent receptor, partial [Bacteroidetes bacterium]|nr:TonB-dependent receptor [Bacteroidota bacterium]